MYAQSYVQLNIQLPDRSILVVQMFSSCALIANILVIKNIFCSYNRAYEL